MDVNIKVYNIILRIVQRFVRETGRDQIRVLVEKRIVSTDGNTSGRQEIVVVEQVGPKAEQLIFIVACEKCEDGLMQCLLAMYDAYQSNGKGSIFGFVTTGKRWRMLRFDGNSWQMSEEILTIFDLFPIGKAKGVSKYVQVADCVHFALENGGRA